MSLTHMNLFSKDTDKEKTSVETGKKTEHPVAEIIRFSAIALIIVIPIRFFIAQPFIVSGASMEQTFHNGEYLIVDQLTYHFSSPKRGEVVIFRYPRDPSTFFIKRVVGVPGDTLLIQGETVTVTNVENPEGVILEEPYVPAMKPSNTITEVLGEGEYFVMGDNRDHSSDSRVWGVLQEEKIIGRALLRLYPFSEISGFPGAYDINEENNIIEPPETTTN